MQKTFHGSYAILETNAGAFNESLNAAFTILNVNQLFPIESKTLPSPNTLDFAGWLSYHSGLEISFSFFWQVY